MKKHNDIVKKSVICISLLCLIWGGYILASRALAKVITVMDDNFSWVYQVDSVETVGKKLIIEGFAFPLGQDTVGGGYEIVLSDLDSDKNVFMEMEYTKRKDVNEYFLCEYDYLYSGFHAKVSLSKVNMKERNYEILLRMADEKTAYRTGIYLSNGEIMFANPATYVSLDVEGTDIENVVKQGVLRVYRPDAGVYVYQYEDYFYWIIEPKYELGSEEDTYIELQLTTSQVDKLSEERLRNRWYYDNLRFKFYEQEIIGGNLGEYRVAKREIPTEYSIVKVWTGKATDEWEWVQYFRPYYYFD